MREARGGRGLGRSGRHGRGLVRSGSGRTVTSSAATGSAAASGAAVVTVRGVTTSSAATSSATTSRAATSSAGRTSVNGAAHIDGADSVAGLSPERTMRSAPGRPTQSADVAGVHDALSVLRDLLSTSQPGLGGARPSDPQRALAWGEADADDRERVRPAQPVNSAVNAADSGHRSESAATHTPASPSSQRRHPPPFDDAEEDARRAEERAAISLAIPREVRKALFG